MDSQFSLRWNNYVNQITDAFGSLLHEEDLVDVTLSCEGKKIKAHKMLLSACSPYFHDIFKDNPCQHPVIVFRNVQFSDLKAIVEFIYCGEVKVLQEQLESFLSTAEMLEVRGLTDKENESEVIETNGIKDRENVQIDSVREQRISSVSRKQVSLAPEKSGPSSLPAKRKRSNIDNSPESPVPSEVATVKEEVEEVDLDDQQDSDVSESEVSESCTPKVSRPGPKSSKKRKVSELLDPLELPDPDPLQLIGQDVLGSGTTGEIKEPIQDKTYEASQIEEAAVEEIGVDPTVEAENIISEEPASPDIKINITTQEQDSPDIEIIEPESTSVPYKKRRTILEGNEIPEKSGQHTEAPELVDITCKKSVPALKSILKRKVQIPKGLTVTPIQSVQKVQDLFDFPTQELQAVHQEEAYIALRSEDATTPVHEEPIPHITSQETQVYNDVPSGQIPEGEPEIAEEAPTLEAEQIEPEVLVEEEPKEPEFDYFGCEICKDEAKPVDLDRISFNHKCPICPCVCFCPHLLKEHMKAIHGWFNVQRRYTHY